MQSEVGLSGHVILEYIRSNCEGFIHLVLDCSSCISFLLPLLFSISCGTSFWFTVSSGAGSLSSHRFILFVQAFTVICSSSQASLQFWSGYLNFWDFLPLLFSVNACANMCNVTVPYLLALTYLALTRSHTDV